MERFPIKKAVEIALNMGLIPLGMETRLRRRIVTHDGDISVDGKKYTVPLPAGTCVKVLDSGEIIPLPQGVSSSTLYLNGFEPAGSL